MDYKEKIDHFFKNIDKDYSLILKGKSLEEVGLNNQLKIKKYYEDLIETINVLLSYISDNLHKLDYLEAFEYIKKAKVVLEKANSYLSKVNEVITVKEAMIADKKDSKDQAKKDEMNALYNGGNYIGFHQEYAYKKSKLPKKGDKKEYSKELLDAVEAYKKLTNKHDADELLNELKGTNKDKNELRSVMQPPLKPQPKPDLNPKPDLKPQPVKEPKKEEVKEEKKEEKKEFSFPASIKDIIEQGLLPKNIAESKLISVCNSLGIPANNLDYKISADLYERLNNDHEIEMARFNTELKGRHDTTIKKYDQLIGDYKKLYNERVKIGSFDRAYVDKLAYTINALIAERNEYKKKINKMKYYDVSSYYQFDKKGEKKAIKAHNKTEKVNDELKEQYKILDEQRKELDRASSKKMKDMIGTRIKLTENRIRSLKSKKSLLNASQVQIINSNSEKYITKMKNKYEKYIYHESEISKTIDESNEISNEIRDYNKEIERLKKDEAIILDDSIKSKYEKIRLNSELKELERRVKNLQNKKGYYNRRIEHHESEIIHISSR